MIILPIHILAGVTALAAGAVALFAAKGANTHRKSGLLFVIAMLFMSASGAIMGTIVELNRINIIAGVLTFYLVTTGLLTVRRTVTGIRWLDHGALLIALGVATAAVLFGFIASNSPRGRLDGMPATGYFIFGMVALLAAVGDIRMLARGAVGAQRIARHLWRMCLALFIATASFFLGQADEFPQAIRNTGLLSIPVLVVVLTSLYWVVRVSFTQWYRRDYLRLPTDRPSSVPAAVPEG